RIADGKFTLDSTEYQLPINNVTNHLHGGEGGFHNVVWDVEAVNDTSIVMSYLSEDGEMSYPGNLNVEVSYKMSPANELLISYRATTDKRTPVMLTNHAFFNLGGEASGTINDHVLEINADRFIVVDSTLIPTGEIAQVEGTVLDFRKPKRIGDDLSKQKVNQHLKNGKGYDHNWPLNKEKPGKMSFAGSIEDPDSGRKLTVYTQEPVLLFYGGNFLDGSDLGKLGKPFEYREAFCLETQHFPDTPNHDNFPSIILEKGDEYSTSSTYQFSTVQ
ncbi:MAG: aldose epimerase family protein, partial [Pricia sp.]